jgi:hypothetical protein
VPLIPFVRGPWAGQFEVDMLVDSRGFWVGMLGLSSIDCALGILCFLGVWLGVWLRV